MKIDQHFFSKVNIVLQRKIFKKKYLSIQSGKLKGIQWINQNDFYKYILGNYEPKATALFLSLIKEDSIFYDLGANIGYYSILASKIVKKGSIFGFEPIPNSRKIFLDHIKINNIQNINVMPYAISDSNKTIQFTNDDNLSANTYLLHQNTKGKRFIDVECVGLDTWLLDTKNPPPTLIKSDIEGAEYDFLVGAQHSIQKYKPTIILATHGKEIKEKCLDLLAQMNYSVHSTEDIKVSSQEDFICLPIK